MMGCLIRLRVTTSLWSKVSGPGVVTFGVPTDVDTTASFSLPGPYVLDLTADDSELQTSDTVTITVNPAGGGDTFEVRVAASFDDAEEVASGSMSRTSSDLELMFQPSGDQLAVGMRFLGVTVPVGATITNAYIQFQTDESSGGASSLSVVGQADANPVTFGSGANDITNRPTTGASVAWSPPDWNVVGEQGPNQQTPNLAAVIQQIIEVPGWASGNAMVLIITGTGDRVAESFNGVPAAAPLIHIEYTTGPQVNQAPVVDAGLDQTITLPAVANLDGTVTDDGLPDPPGVTTSLWSKVSGPGVVTFGVPTDVDTTASFSLPGPYVLDLTADDSELQTSDTVTITVNPAGGGDTFEVRVAASFDDAEEVASGSMSARARIWS